MIEMRQLQVFMAIWNTGSFSLAAKDVHLTQPTVSGHIRTLEDSFGVQLFDRSGRKVTPTKAGELLYPYARQVLRLINQAEREMDLFMGREKGKLELGGSNIPGQYILPLMVGRFKADYPNIQITLRIGDTSSIVSAVASGEMELGVVGAVVQKKGLTFEACFDDELILIVPPGHRLADSAEVRPAELVAEPFVVREKGSGTRMATEHAFEEHGEVHLSEMNIVAEMGSTEAVLQAVRSGVGCAIVSRRAADDDLVHGFIFSPAIKGIDLHRQFYLVWHERRTLSPLGVAFRNFLLSGRM